MKYSALMILTLWCSVGFSQSSPERLPTVRADFFSPGRSWTWDYSQGREFFSSERYTVISLANDIVTIEMSTRLKGEEPKIYRPHHRIEVSIKKCLEAYPRPGIHGVWSYNMYYLNGSLWEVYEPQSTLAFEEKFNCNPFVTNDFGQPFKTVFHESEKGRLFEQKPWGRLESTQFKLEGEFAGTAIQKVFANPAGEPYKFELQTNQL